MPSAKVIVADTRERGTPEPPSADEPHTDRVLWIRGESCSSENVEKLRRFLRGEGYSWASDLCPPPQDGSFPDTGSRFAEAEQQNKTKILLGFAGDLSKFAELQPMLHEALSRYLEILRCDAGSIYLWDENTETLVLDAAHGPEREKRLGLRQKLGEGLAGWVAEVGEPILVTDSRKVQKLRGRAERRYTNFSCLAVPVMHGGQLFGVVCLTMPRDNRPFTAADLALTQALSQRLASAIRPLNVLSELRRFSERLSGAFKSSADLVLEKDTQVEVLRDLSKQILNSVPLCVVAYDRELRVRSANAAARNLFGPEVAQSRDRNSAPLEDGLDMDRELWRSKLRGVVENRHAFRLQRVGFRAERDKRLLDIHCSPLNDAAGNATGGILTVQDMTEDVEMENKLQAAQRLALVGKIAAKVAHELNNPLDGILRFLNLALRKITHPEQARSYLEESRRGLLRMGNILSQLLAFSRSHYGAHRPASFNQLIHQGLAPYEHRAQESNIDIRVEVPSNLPLCSCPEVREVFGNVIKNALDAVSENGVIEVSAAHRDEHVTIAVADNGPGVPENLREKIFEPFFTTKKEGDGTGLGLAVCRDSLRRIGGDITLTPSQQGARFEIAVPVKQETE